ncbi:hypothetical protein K402DRAFT_188749 [Aulographum hederae CBS 113979]|uniref:Fungal N-terminal domain-containing protein n=1 Tax=Aulographum hederae CBS 113979 TaxID=1176131 RepID=A0A6G1GP69_9PEZI|nr:hypothetical protein K402DRAFT_188749 [Aulographum hederae CBS 113979]
MLAPANVVFVCGLLYVTIRFGIEITGLYDRARSAFQDVDSLLTTLRTLTETLLTTKSYIDQHEQSPFSTDDNHVLPVSLFTNLLHCQRTLSGLRILAESSLLKEEKQGWLSQVVTQWHWEMGTGFRVCWDKYHIAALTESLTPMKGDIQNAIQQTSEFAASGRQG